jgi:hypothetical protein
MSRPSVTVFRSVLILSDSNGACSKGFSMNCQGSPWVPNLKNRWAGLWSAAVVSCCGFPLWSKQNQCRIALDFDQNRSRLIRESIQGAVLLQNRPRTCLGEILFCGRGVWGSGGAHRVTHFRRIPPHPARPLPLRAYQALLGSASWTSRLGLKTRPWTIDNTLDYTQPARASRREQVARL